MTQIIMRDGEFDEITGCLAGFVPVEDVLALAAGMAAGMHPTGVMSDLWQGFLIPAERGAGVGNRGPRAGVRALAHPDGRIAIVPTHDSPVLAVISDRVDPS